VRRRAGAHGGGKAWERRGIEGGVSRASSTQKTPQSHAGKCACVCAKLALGHTRNCTVQAWVHGVEAGGCPSPGWEAFRGWAGTLTKQGSLRGGRSTGCSVVAPCLTVAARNNPKSTIEVVIGGEILVEKVVLFQTNQAAPPNSLGAKSYCRSKFRRLKQNCTFKFKSPSIMMLHYAGMNRVMRLALSKVTMRM
jgi:hypothetical protein